MPPFQEIYQMHLKNKILTLVCFVITVKVSAFEEVYYGDGIKDVVVNSQETSLLVFPAPPVARICQPSGVLDFFPLENDDLNENLNLNNMNWSESSSHKIDDGLEKMLKLRPYKDGESTLCDIKLSNKETVRIRFKTSQSIRRPSIELVNIFSKEAKKERRYDVESLEIFQKLVSGGELLDFYDITTSKTDPVSKSTSKGNYELSYVGTDRERFKVWNIKVKATLKLDLLPELKNVQLNQLYFSAWKAIQNPLMKPRWIEGSEFNLYVLSSNDISTDEMLEKLP